MSSTICTVAHTIWIWLPEITVGLQCAIALIECYLATDLLIRYLRRPR